jgi:hypothetical protein
VHFPRADHNHRDAFAGSQKKGAFPGADQNQKDSFTGSQKTDDVEMLNMNPNT